MTSPSSGTAECFRLAGAVAGQRLSSGDTWIGLSWLSSTGMAMMVDDQSVGSTKLSVRAKINSNSAWTAWQDHPTATLRVFLIRLTVDHGGSTPDPDPDPAPPTDDTAPCHAAGDGVNLSGYHVFMCIVAGNEVSQLPTYKLSSKAAILGTRADPKATIKIVSSCQWGAVAAVTTARPSQIRVYNTANGKEWEHNHSGGALAPSGFSGDALCDDDDDDEEAPDLVVSSPSVSDSSPSAGDSFTLRTTVRNQGDGRSAATTLRYYRSSDSRISTSDTQVGTDAVSALSASRSSAESISLTAPSSAGTYYYGACVDSVSGESATNNNCSSAVRIVVEEPSPPPDDSYCRNDSVVKPGGRCDIYSTSFYFEVQSNGTGCLRAGGITSCSGRSQNWRNSTLNGVRITFVASRNSDDSWTISEVDPSP